MTGHFSGRHGPLLCLSRIAFAPIKDYLRISMDIFKRNQVEEAIFQTLRVRDERRIDELRLRLKRLLVTDRRLGRRPKSKGNAKRPYAFYGGEPPGSGVEVMFSGYEAFALMAALIVLEHGIPQAKVVSILQAVRSDLEAAHRETLETDPKVLFDPEAVRAMNRPGMIAADNTAPVFLAFVKLDAGQGRVRAIIAVCRSQDELVRFIKEHSVLGSGSTHFEFTRLMHDLATYLSTTRPVKRGRSTL
jgi:hypothetical protein